MNLRTFRGTTMAEALTEVKKGLGKDAVILHTRTYRVGGVMGLGGREVFEITASDSALAKGPRLRERALAAPISAPAAPHDRFVADSFHRTAPIAALDPGVAVVDAKPRPPDRRPITTRVQPAPVNPDAADELRAELAAIKRLVGQVLQCSRRTEISVAQPGATPVLNVGGMPDALFSLYLRLQEQGVGVESAEAIIADAREELTPEELADAGIVRQSLVRHLSKRLPVVGSISTAGPRPDGRPLTIALIGPTGVGKTTTLAKLAAAYKLRQGKSVALITADTYRIAAVDQLRTYANIIGLPIKVAMTPDEMTAACRSFAGVDVLLIDTAGRSQHDRTRLAELRSFIAAANPHETHLTLAATSAEPVLLDTASRFSPLGPDRLVFTKLDEALALGVLVKLLDKTGLKVSFITDGQEVPDQIELANADRLAKAILDAEVAR